MVSQLVCRRCFLHEILPEAESYLGRGGEC
jgi:hypothetical protein